LLLRNKTDDIGPSDLALRISAQISLDLETHSLYFPI